MAFQGRSCDLCGKDYTGTKTKVCTEGQGLKACGGEVLPLPDDNEEPTCPPSGQPAKRKARSNT